MIFPLIYAFLGSICLRARQLEVSVTEKETRKARTVNQTDLG